MDSILINLLKKGNLVFFGYAYEAFPEIIGKYDPKRIKVFCDKKKLKNNLYKVNFFKRIDNINEPCDVLFLDNKYALNIIKNLPINAQYIAISLKNPLLFPFIIIGIIRRIILQRYSYVNVKILIIKSKLTFWLFLKRNTPRNGYEFYLSRNIGIEKFLEFLYINKINYIIPRFFETLPKLKSINSDLDLIVSEEDVKYVKEYLLNNVGDIRVDVWSTCPKDNLGKSYVNKEIIKGVFERKEIGPCKSMIPSSKDYLNLLIYHSLYHKGLLSGIKSGLVENQSKKTKKYYELIKKLSIKNNINVGDDMEEMHLYMQNEGWAPNKKMIKQLSKNNYWLRTLRKRN